VRELAVGEESHGLGVNARNANRTWFTFHDVAYLLEVEQIAVFDEDNSEVVGVLRDAGVSIVYRRYTAPPLELPFAFDALWRTVIVTPFLEIGWRIQIEYDDCCISTLSRTKCG
jgi:hypothetical protein